MKLFGDLSKAEQDELREAHKLLRLEVSCPWWPGNHWEDKIHGDLWDECYYRIKKDEQV